MNEGTKNSGTQNSEESGFRGHGLKRNFHDF
jgi:hypothetical protein